MFLLFFTVKVGTFASIDQNTLCLMCSSVFKYTRFDSAVIRFLNIVVIKHFFSTAGDHGTAQCGAYREEFLYNSSVTVSHCVSLAQ